MLTMKQARRIHRDTQTTVRQEVDGEGNVIHRSRYSITPFRKWFRSWITTTDYIEFSAKIAKVCRSR